MRSKQKLSVKRSRNYRKNKRVKRSRRRMRGGDIDNNLKEAQKCVNKKIDYWTKKEKTKICEYGFTCVDTIEHLNLLKSYLNKNNLNGSEKATAYAHLLTFCPKINAKLIFN